MSGPTSHVIYQDDTRDLSTVDAKSVVIKAEKSVSARKKIGKFWHRKRIDTIGIDDPLDLGGGKK